MWGLIVSVPDYCLSFYFVIWYINSSHASYLTLNKNAVTAIVVMFHKHFRTVSECFRDVLTKHSRNV